MEEHIVKILSIQRVTHNVKHYRVEKPAGYQFVPGQATEVAIHKPGWEQERRPFTFTSLNSWDFLEFTIKSYHDHPGVTHQLDSLQPGDELILHDVWGAIQYKGEGVFIAGGAGVTPFIAILRQLQTDGKLGNNMLIFSNKTKADIILEDEFRRMLGDRFINTLTQERVPGYDYGEINADYLKQKIKNFDQHFYVCGPDQMVHDIKAALHQLGASESAVVVEL
ncbi:FAD-binding oxidoreductase [Thermoflavifilum thermophilum]|uniref:Ferredoxin-NADP reductase n=1 Tax=Thermoflavifilum thermophilum TaxID=1393122 RepID=A0A1I7MYU6_9BACT|nr:FAD-binding oxidoreductase [Thermoflavifilum thermophilum]SFV27572.1 Ferredoxin-NADP reductase [Thermoflavifilum thermophilum]